MPINFADRLVHAWNAFSNPGIYNTSRPVNSSTTRLDKTTRNPINDRTIVAAVYNRIAIDCASIHLRHVKVNEEGEYVETVKSKINYCLDVEANIDQTGRAFLQDLVQSLCDEGYVAVVPVETDLNPNNTMSFDITNLRVGKITQWYPDRVKVNLYNEKEGRHREVIVPKKFTAIIENPLYSVMNSNNSTFKRLLRKLALLDVVDEQTSSGKLNMLVQLPYTIKSETRREQAVERTKELERQLSEGKHGIAYIDGTEKITQLSRPLENHLMEQIEYLMGLLYSQLGISKEVMEGKASEVEMLNYYDRTIEPIMNAIADEFRRKFLSKTAITQGQRFMFFRDHFKLAPLAQVTEAADKLTRNEIMTSNEFRSILGLKPSSDEKADMLLNKNMPIQDTKLPGQNPAPIPAPGQSPVQPQVEDKTIDEKGAEYVDYMSETPVETTVEGDIDNDGIPNPEEGLEYVETGLGIIPVRFLMDSEE